MNITEDIKEYINTNGLSLAEIVRSTGLKHSTISSLINRKGASPSISTLEKLLDAYPNILSNNNAIALSKKSNDGGPPNWPGLPIFEAPVTLGLIETIRDEPVMSPDFYLPVPQFRDCTFGTRAAGDSMYPEIRNGDYVICKEVTDVREIIMGDIYLVITNGGMETVKYIHPHPSNKDYLILAARNESIPKTELPKEAIRKVYKVKGVLKAY